MHYVLSSLNSNHEEKNPVKFTELKRQSWILDTTDMSLMYLK